ncbi:MAG: 2-enoate reductase, partial [Clostridia bacterium]|nr:2-enoate reductase [Clostridia bacterium]
MANSSMLKELLRYHDVAAYLSAKVKEITDRSVVIHQPTAPLPKKELFCDSVILSVGYAPDTRFAALRERKGGKPVYFVGDCDKVGSLKTVIKQAYELVQKLSYQS